MSSVRAVFSVFFIFCSVGARAQGIGKAAEVNGAAISTAEVDAKLGNSIAQLQEQIFTLRRKQLDMMIDQKLLEDESAKRGRSIAAVVQAEVTSRVTPATSGEAAKFFSDNSDKLKGDFKTLEEQIRNFLTAQRTQKRQQEFLKSLREAATIEVFLSRPPVFRAEIATAGSPVRGSAGAPVTIVEFSDFHCPFCRKVQPVLEDLRARYGERIRMVYRDFPLDNLHAQARAAAEASHCAAEQGKFWEFHDRLFRNDPDTSQSALNRMAREAGLDINAFGICIASGKYRESVQASALEGTRLGVTGTPTFFINGRILVGAQPLDAFAAMIDEELAAVSPLPSAPRR